METKIIKESDFESNIEIICNFFKQGEIVAIPTETVYGLAGNALNSQTILKIFEAKSRPADNPLIIHTDSIEKIYGLVKDTSSEKFKLSIEVGKKFWPGPLSILFPKASIIPDIVTGGLDTVVIRIPSHPLTKSILSHLGLFDIFI
jgi:L-threonylcarbamoyladenylate synthase